MATFQRTTKAYGNEESLYIYAGSTATGEPIYSETIGLQVDTVYEPTTHCLTYGTYFAQMGDSYGDGWTSGSKLSIKLGDVEVAVIQWSCGGSSSNNLLLKLLRNGSIPQRLRQALLGLLESWIGLAILETSLRPLPLLVTSVVLSK